MLQLISANRRRLIKDVRGNVAVLFGVGLIPIVLGVGVAVDYGRALMVRERIQGAHRCGDAGCWLVAWP